ncbi:hypothetical protein P152DRAFT_414546 [Eremomyces bilateralis CBS 781.70]|uniref:Uncharacterized protein n=1 Tax=Eremomyces bilateralis CBS 781.70 TaxID=1392243 RepID=A0A6G1G7U3_9PEZI|nr:uncharacterized protein P152DRAFT_414546 [Eremomyces bilateralis CBS 781.70]KAF1813991.1 hypothetical protein P152DRAFT_414546 [Eremomyces bilateralis CBS 781.70]
MNISRFNPSNSDIPEHTGNGIQPTTADSDDERPGKRQKLSAKTETPSYVLSVTISNDRNHIVAITAEDKAVRVFEVEKTGELKELSKRCMFKRPSTVELSDDDSTIFVGDKFGDAYSLPLLPAADFIPKAQVSRTETQSKPAASLTTVHTAANRKILEAQMKAIDAAKPKEGLPFEAKLLLGHVSLMTDLKFVTLENESGGGKRRSYLVTADRDEHIRVSRGPSQAHIIENFCLGHTEFVSKLCFIGKGRYLVSGGGDDELFVWDWLQSKLLRKVDLRGPVEACRGAGEDSSSANASVPDRVPICVTGLWRYVVSGSECVLIACEGVAGIFLLNLEPIFNAGASPQISWTTLPGNLLDTVVSESSIVVSVDGIHAKNSCSVVRESVEGQQLCVLKPHGDGATFDVDDFFTDSNERRETNRDQIDKTKVAERLYTTGLLRKRRGQEGESGDVEEME